MRRVNIDWLGHRNIMFGLSAILIVVSIGALAVRGLDFGIEFQGGTAMTVGNSGAVTIEQMRKVLADTGVKDAEIQTTSEGGSKGFLIRTDETNPREAARQAAEAASALKLPRESFQVNTIGPGWGQSVTNSAIIALAVSILAILLYISLRFEYKMSITAVIALVHDILITLGVYSLVGYQVTPNTVAALLTILGYSLYDTVVVFHRIKENSQTLTKQTFMQMANESLNEVIVRTMNTSITGLLPVVIMLFFGGETLRDFALALTIGLAVGAYSSIGVATPIFVLWKETEPKFAALKKKYANA